ncbi:hypothetical protein BGZ65_003688 [Modicella reniformis]|uniref:Histone H1 n=1 Tax=Modicella reniformis TaxID=1440133 RepID=A0A9P6SN17_9FUNG|nr:hypothetical protein BGZ65_003688 [Modicella reniformis]
MSLTGQQLPQDVKESYLRSLTKSSLVKLISMIESYSPTVKLYPSHLSSTTAHSEQARFTTPSIPETLIPPRDLIQGSDQGMTSTSAQQGIPGTQADYFNSFVAHLQPGLNSPLSSIQESTADGSGTSNVSTKLTTALTVQVEAKKPGATGATDATGATGTSSQPATPSTPKTLARQTPALSSGAGGTAYATVKALDLPPYEEMIFTAIAALKQDGGSAPKAILDWVQANFPVPESFRASCGQAISKAAKKGRLLKDGTMYKLKPGYNYPRVSNHRVLKTLYPPTTQYLTINLHSYLAAESITTIRIDACPFTIV